MKKNITKRIIMVGIGIVIFGGLFYYVNQYLTRFFASGDSIKVNLSPENQTKNVGDEMVINVDMSGQKISAAEIYVTYDSSLLSYYKEYNVGTTASGVTSLNNYFQEPLISEITTVGDGTSPIKQLKLALVSLNVPTAEPAQIHLRFKAKKDGNAVVTLDKTKTQVAGPNTSNAATYFAFDSTSISANVKIGTSGTTVTPSDPTPPITSIVTQIIPSASPSGTIGQATIKMVLRFQSINTVPKTNKVLVQIGTDKTNPDDTQEVEFTAEEGGKWVGTFTVDKISLDGDSVMYVKGPKHIRKKICVNVPTENLGGTYKCDNDGNIQLQSGENSLDFSGVLLLAGDLPVQDGLINAPDLAFIRQNFGNRSEDALQRGDLNLDGIIDTQDFSMILQTLAFKYDEE